MRRILYHILPLVWLLALLLVALVVVFAAITYVPSPGGSWTMTGGLNIARLGHTATLLNNGKVLITGGIYSYDIITNTGHSEVELYDPTTGIWTLTGSMHSPRAFHTATLLPNGKVLVTGGSRGSTISQSIASAELYDPATGTWTPTGGMHIPRALHTATLLPNGKVLVAGGVIYSTTSSSSVSASAELYDPATGTWTLTGGMHISRAFHTATLLPNGKVLVTGGEVNNNKAIAPAELYDPTTGIWTLTGSMHNPRAFHTATLLPNGKVLVTGGSRGSTISQSIASAELYDPATGTWTPTGGMHIPRAFHTATLLPNGEVLVAGGGSSLAGLDTASIASAELYDPATGTWTLTGGMHMPRAFHTATLLPNGKVLVAGGENNLGSIIPTELFFMVYRQASFPPQR